MPPIRSLELLQEMLAGQLLTPAGLDDLMQNHQEENQHIDFKDGLLLTNDVKKARATVRQYVSAFANATGGTLVVGVNEPARTAAGTRPPRAVSPGARPGGQPLDEWAREVLRDLAPYLTSPPPRFHVVPHPQGEVLVVSTARAPSLVPLVEEGLLVHYLRLHDSTVKAHDWLISDLVLGRRNHPVVEMTARTDIAERDEVISVQGNHIYPGVLISYILDVVNASLVSADYVDAGIVTWACTKNGRIPHRELLSFVDAGDSPGAGEEPGKPDSAVLQPASDPPAWALLHLQAAREHNKPQELRPFVEVRASPAGKALYPLLSRLECEVTLAAYAMPKGAPPTWFEVVFRYANRFGITSAPKVTPVPTRRPRLGWKPIT